MQERLPFPIRAIQIDGGSEFKAEFESYCQEQGIQLVVLPPHSPKLNGMVERLQRTYRDEFYACVDTGHRVPAVAAALHQYEHTYNHVRPHQALRYRTPAQFLNNHAGSSGGGVTYPVNQHIHLTSASSDVMMAARLLRRARL